MRVKGVVVGAVLVGVIIFLSIKPSNDRDWTTDQSVLPYGIEENGAIRLFNIRNFTYRSNTDFTPSYYNAAYNLDNLDELYFIVVPFPELKGAAHTFLSFGFNGSYVAISVEIRKEKGESYSALKGLFKRYEVMYVIADERDVVRLRTDVRNNTVYLYPVNTTEEKMRELFLDMVSRANELKEKPEFYNTLYNTCTTNIVSHVNNISPKKIPFSYKVLLPEYSDELAYSLGLIGTNLSLEDARKQFKITERAQQLGDDPEFSRKIRQE